MQFLYSTFLTYATSKCFSHTVKPILRDHLSWKTRSIFLTQDPIFQCNWTGHQRPPVLRETIFAWPMGWSFKTGSTVPLTNLHVQLPEQFITPNYMYATNTKHDKGNGINWNNALSLVLYMYQFKLYSLIKWAFIYILTQSYTNL